MSQFLQTVLSAKEPLFSSGLTKLEKTTGNSSVDVRLIADITSKAHTIMRKLGLDIKDTTGHELYFALMSAVRNGKAEDLLSDSDYTLIIIDKKVISFNLIDVVNNFHHELSYDKQIISHGQRSLRGELVGRYLSHARTNDETTKNIAFAIGLMPESDAWYNNLKQSINKQDLKETTK